MTEPAFARLLAVRKAQGGTPATMYAVHRPILVAVLFDGETPIELKEGVTVLGRSSGCDVRLDDPKISRRHIRVIVGRTSVTAQDLGSANGTFRNGERIRSRFELHDGDELMIGERVLKVLIIEETPVTESTEFVPLGRDTTTHPYERRRHPRFSTQLETLYMGPGRTFETIMSDISLSGVFLSTECLDRLGTKCRLRILTDDGQPIDLSGVVRRVDARRNDKLKPGLGIEFVGLDDSAKRWIEGIVTGTRDSQWSSVSKGSHVAPQTH